MISLVIRNRDVTPAMFALGPISPIKLLREEEAMFGTLKFNVGATHVVALLLTTCDGLVMYHGLIHDNRQHPMFFLEDDVPSGLLKDHCLSIASKGYLPLLVAPLAKPTIHLRWNWIALERTHNDVVEPFISMSEMLVESTHSVVRAAIHKCRSWIAGFLMCVLLRSFASAMRSQNVSRSSLCALSWMRDSP